MSTVNKAWVYTILPSRAKAKYLQVVLDRKRVKATYTKTRSGNHEISFPVSRGMTIQEAILLLSHLVPEGTEVYAS